MYIYSLYLNCLLRFPAAPPSGENWQLKVDKSIMFVQHIRQGILSASSMSQADTSDLLSKIMQVGLVVVVVKSGKSSRCNFNEQLFRRNFNGQSVYTL